MNLLEEKITNLQVIIDKIKTKKIKSNYKVDLDLLYEKENNEKINELTKQFNKINLFTEKLQKMKKLINTQKKFINLYFILIRYLEFIYKKNISDNIFLKIYRNYLSSYILPLNIIREIINDITTNYIFKDFNDKIFPNAVSKTFKIYLINNNINNNIELWKESEENSQFIETELKFLQKDEINYYDNLKIKYEIKNKESINEYEDCDDIDLNKKEFLSNFKITFKNDNIDNFEISLEILYYKCNQVGYLYNENKEKKYKFIIKINEEEFIEDSNSINEFITPSIIYNQDHFIKHINF